MLVVYVREQSRQSETDERYRAKDRYITVICSQGGHQNARYMIG